MQFREVTLPSGQRFQVPQGIQRIDSKSTHGWQVRCQGTKLFSDGKPADPRQALASAMRELLERVSTLPVNSPLKHGPSAGKSSDLPAGISGPILRVRQGRVPTAELSVSLPCFGRRVGIKSVYIGSQNTYTEDKYREALAKCIELRASAVERYLQDAEKARRATMASLRKQLQALR